MQDNSSDYIFKAYITNTAAYDSGERDNAGTWLYFPANAEEITNKLNRDNGTLGLLMNDPQLYHNLNRTMRDADSLVVNLRQHPKRYVHFSIFGKKDK